MNDESDKILDKEKIDFLNRYLRYNKEVITFSDLSNMIPNSVNVNGLYYYVKVEVRPHSFLVTYYGYHNDDILVQSEYGNLMDAYYDILKKLLTLDSSFING